MKFTFKFLSIFLFFFGTNSLPASDVFLKEDFKISTFSQDKTILIKKIKAKLNALEMQREKLKILKKWSDSKEKSYLLNVENLTKNLEKLGVTTAKKLNIDALIKKLQKELKYLNNSRVNKNAKKTWSKKDNALYEKKAGKLIDSIIQLRMKKV